MCVHLVSACVVSKLLLMIPCWYFVCCHVNEVLIYFNNFEDMFVFVYADATDILPIAVGAAAGVAVLVAIGTAIAIFCLCFYYPHR